MLLPALGLSRLELLGSKAPLLFATDAEVFLLGLVLPCAVGVQRAHGQQDVGVGIVAVGVVDGGIGAHAVADELGLDELSQQSYPLGLVHLDGQGDHEFPCEAAVLGLFVFLHGVP